jgi:hypothetical protein
MNDPTAHDRNRIPDAIAAKPITQGCTAFVRLAGTCSIKSFGPNIRVNILPRHRSKRHAVTTFIMSG